MLPLERFSRDETGEREGVQTLIYGETHKSYDSDDLSSLTLASHWRFGSTLQLSLLCTRNESNYSHSIKACHITPSAPISNLDHQ